MSIKDKIIGNQQYSLRYIDKTFWVLFTFLILAALIALFSASSTLVYKSGSTFGPIGRQFFFIIVGVGLAWCTQFLPTWVIRFLGYILLAVSVLLLYTMLIPHNPFVISINGAGRWFRIFGFSFQPSEFAKVSLVIVIADQLARIKDGQPTWPYFLRTMGIAAVTIFPIMVGNLSTAILMGSIVVMLWILARIDWRLITGFLGSAVLLLIIGYFIVEFAFVRPGHRLPGLFGRASVWAGRIDSMVEEMSHKSDTYVLTDENYQRSLSKVAIARGGASPLGVLPGNSKERDFLPLAYADYIFAIIIEETGFIGASILIFLYMAILFRACFASSRFGDHNAMLMMMGLALMITCQALISMAVAVGIGPVTGQPLPMITMGGSSALATALYFGIMMAVSREQNVLMGKQIDVKNDSENDVPDLDNIDVNQ